MSAAILIPEQEVRVSSVYQPWPKQAQFHSSRARYRLFGGAQGPGKSLALLWEAIIHCLRFPGSNSLLLRHTCPELDRGLIAHLDQQILAKDARIIGGRKNFNRNDRIVRFPNGSTLQFGYCEAFKDVYRYDGPEYVFIGLDELTQFAYRIWEHFRLRNRCIVPGSRACMAGATNPGGENGEWVKALWIDRKRFPGMEEYQYDKDDYEFIPASVWDNPTYANDPEYIKNLQQMNPGLRAQRLEGRWDKFEGQFFTNWSPDRHIWDSRNTNWTIPTWWPRWISLDWGFAHHSAIHWHTIGEVLVPGETTKRKLVMTYREMTVREKTAEQLGKLIAERTEGEKIQHLFAGADLFQRKESPHTLADQLGDELRKHGLPRPAPADSSGEGNYTARVAGWNLMYQLLELDGWMVFDSCAETIKAIPSLIRNPEKLEDVKKAETLADDIGDSLRMGLKSYLRPRSKPLELQLKEKIESIPDHTARMMYAFEHRFDVEKANEPVKPRFVMPWEQRA